MSDVSIYEFKALASRVEALEKENLRQLEERTERMHRRTDALMRWTLIGLWMIAAIVLTVALTFEASGNR